MHPENTYRTSHHPLCNLCNPSFVHVLYSKVTMETMHISIWLNTVADLQEPSSQCNSMHTRCFVQVAVNTYNVGDNQFCKELWGILKSSFEMHPKVWKTWKQIISCKLWTTLKGLFPDFSIIFQCHQWVDIHVRKFNPKFQLILI